MSLPEKFLGGAHAVKFYYVLSVRSRNSFAGATNSGYFVTTRCTITYFRLVFGRPSFTNPSMRYSQIAFVVVHMAEVEGEEVGACVALRLQVR